MGMYNCLKTKLICPKCNCEIENEVQFYLGELLLDDYILGDKIKWKEGLRPLNGNDVGQGYGYCMNCRFEFWADIIIQNDIITEAVIRPDEANYCASKFPKYECMEMADNIKDIVRNEVEKLLFRCGFAPAVVKLAQKTINGTEKIRCYRNGDLYCQITICPHTTISGELKDWVLIEYADSLYEAEV